MCTTYNLWTHRARFKRLTFGVKQESLAASAETHVAKAVEILKGVIRETCIDTAGTSAVQQ
eukprot:1121090-Pleurochrysis_carterae.AAC.2